MAKTVKARKHNGANSLDLTIPVDFVKQHHIESGEIFEHIVHWNNSELMLIYKKVYGKKTIWVYATLKPIAKFYISIYIDCKYWYKQNNKWREQWVTKRHLGFFVKITLDYY